MDELDQVIERMEETVTKAGYSIGEGVFEHGFMWETGNESSEDFYGRADAVVSAFADFSARATS